eukprot:6199631-Pleurochrysis_carterae.AAC.1
MAEVLWALGQHSARVLMSREPKIDFRASYSYLFGRKEKYKIDKVESSVRALNMLFGGTLTSAEM